MGFKCEQYLTYLVLFTQPPPRIYEDKNEIIEGVLFLDPAGMTYHAGPYPNHFITPPGIFTFN